MGFDKRGQSWNHRDHRDLEHPPSFPWAVNLCPGSRHAFTSVLNFPELRVSGTTHWPVFLSSQEDFEARPRGFGQQSLSLVLLSRVVFHLCSYTCWFVHPSVHARLHCSKLRLLGMTL